MIVRKNHNIDSNCTSTTAFTSNLLSFASGSSISGIFERSLVARVPKYQKPEMTTVATATTHGPICLHSVSSCLVYVLWYWNTDEGTFHSWNALVHIKILKFIPYIKIFYNDFTLLYNLYAEMTLVFAQRRALQLTNQFSIKHLDSM